MNHFDRHRGLIVVKADVHGPIRPWTANMVLDTGATRTVVTPTLLSNIGVSDVNALRPMRVIGATGAAQATRVILPRITALGVTRRQLLATVVDLPEALKIDGLLGLDFFRDQCLVIDLRQQTVLVD